MKKSRGIRKSVQKTRKDRKGLRYRKSKKGKRTMRKKIRRSKVGGSGREDDIKKLVEFMASYDDDDESGEIRLAAPVDVVDEALEKAEKRQKKKGVLEKKVGTKPPVDTRKGGANIGSNKEFPSLSKK